MQCRRCGRLDFDMEPGDMEPWQFRFSQKERVFPKSKKKSEELHMNIFSGWWQLKYFLCSSLFREDYQFDLYFSDGLKPPTSYWCTEEAHLKQKKHAYFGYSHVFTCVCVVSQRTAGNLLLIRTVGRNPGKTQMKQSGTFENLLFSEHVPIRRSNSGRM